MPNEVYDDLKTSFDFSWGRDAAGGQIILFEAEKGKNLFLPALDVCRVDFALFCSGRAVEKF